MEFAENLKYLRNLAQYTQKELAQKVGLSANCVCEWEKSRNEPSLSTVKKLAEIFDVSSDYLLGLEDETGVRAVAPMSESLTASERELLDTFRQLSPYLQGLALDTVRGWAGGTVANNSRRNI